MMSMFDQESCDNTETEGVVSGEMGDHGYIDGDVFYSSAALQDGHRPRKWEPVHYIAVESQQGRCPWRAVTVCPSQKPHIAKYGLIHVFIRKRKFTFLVFILACFIKNICISAVLN